MYIYRICTVLYMNGSVYDIRTLQIAKKKYLRRDLCRRYRSTHIYASLYVSVGHLPIPSNFTTVGKPQIFVNQYDSPIEVYSEASLSWIAYHNEVIFLFLRMQETIEEMKEERLTATNPEYAERAAMKKKDQGGGDNMGKTIAACIKDLEIMLLLHFIRSCRRPRGASGAPLRQDERQAVRLQQVQRHQHDRRGLQGKVT